MSQPSPNAYQFRYLAYCAALGRTPEEQLAHDRQRYPGGSMVGYIVWISNQWARFEDMHQRHLQRTLHHAEFDRWLAAQLGGHSCQPCDLAG